jgi:hypothetical protein
MLLKLLEFEGATLIGTWFGIIGCILGPYYLMLNLLEFASGILLLGSRAVRRIWFSGV